MCERKGALIDGDEVVRFCRWSREGKCSHTIPAARRRYNETCKRNGVRLRYTEAQCLDEPQYFGSKL